MNGVHGFLPFIGYIHKPGLEFPVHLHPHGAAHGIAYHGMFYYLRHIQHSPAITQVMNDIEHMIRHNGKFQQKRFLRPLARPILQMPLPCLCRAVRVSPEKLPVHLLLFTLEGHKAFFRVVFDGIVPAAQRHGFPIRSRHGQRRRFHGLRAHPGNVFLETETLVPEGFKIIPYSLHKLPILARQPCQHIPDLRVRPLVSFTNALDIRLIPHIQGKGDHVFPRQLFAHALHIFTIPAHGKKFLARIGVEEEFLQRVPRSPETDGLVVFRRCNRAVDVFPHRPRLAAVQSQTQRLNLGMYGMYALERLERGVLFFHRFHGRRFPECGNTLSDFLRHGVKVSLVACRQELAAVAFHRHDLADAVCHIPEIIHAHILPEQIRPGKGIFQKERIAVFLRAF